MEKLTLKAMFEFIRNVNDEPDLTAEDRSTLLYYLGYSGENWLSHNSHAAEKTGLCEKTIQNCRRHLKAKRIISTERVYDQQNYQKQGKKHGVKGTRTIVNYWYKGGAETGNQNTGNENTGNQNTGNDNTELKDPNSYKREVRRKIEEILSADSAERNPYVREEGGTSPLPPAPPKKDKAKKPKKESRKKSPFNPPDPELLKKWEIDERQYFEEICAENDKGMKIPRHKELRDFLEKKIIQQCDNIQYWDDEKLNDITEYYWDVHGTFGWDGIRDWRGYLYKRLEQYDFLYELN
jgi:hypothetical protein